MSTRYTFVRRRLTPAIAVALAGVAAAAQPRAAEQRAIAPGCYRLALGAWSSASRLGPDRPTTVFRLDTVPRRPGLPGDLAAERVDPAEFAAPGDPRLRWRKPAGWRRRGEDSVEVYMWSTSTESEAFYGRWVGSALRGVVRRTSDAIPTDRATGRILWDEWPWASASAVAVPCP